MSVLNSDEARAYAAQVARRRGWKVNTDEGMLSVIAAGLSRQSERFGKPFCPCRDIDGGEQDLICPCVYAQADIEEHGQCYCGLFLSPAKDPAAVQSIPERRPSDS